MSANKAVRAPSRISPRGPPDFGAFKLELFLNFELWILSLFLTSSLNFILGPGRAELRILRMRPDLAAVSSCAAELQFRLATVRPVGRNRHHDQIILAIGQRESGD